MDETTFRILDMLARNLGRPTSINGLTTMIKEAHGTGFYKNIYDRVSELAKEGILKIETVGKNSIISLDLGNYKTLSMLSEMEMKKKRELPNNELGMLFLEMETYFSQDFRLISSISAIDPKANIKLRRAEFLFILKGNDEAEEKAITKLMESFHRGHNLKLDCLMLTQTEISKLLASKEYNPIKSMIANKLILLYPQNYWLGIKDMLSKGLHIQPSDELNLAKLGEADLEYNLARFGYKELGGNLKPGREICLETIITSVLIQGDARKTDAIPILLAKNKANYPMLIFLARKYNQDGKLLGLLKALNSIRKVEGVKDAIAGLEALGAKAKPANEKTIREKLRLYNAD